MFKKNIQQLIEVGYIKGLSERAILICSGENLNIHMISDNEQIIYHGTLKNFNDGIDPFNGERIQPVDLTYLLKALKTLSDDIEIEYIDSENPYIIVKDDMFSIECALINKKKEKKIGVINLHDQKSIDIEINKSWITSFRKMAVAASECKHVYLYRDDNNIILDMNQGIDEDGTKSIKITLPISSQYINLNISPRKFTLKEMKSVIYNMRIFKSGLMRIYENSIIGFHFENEKIMSITNMIGIDFVSS